MEFNKYFDHTFLKAFATKQDIDMLCQQAKELNTASVCVNEEWVAYCKNLLKDTDVMICSVVGFPLGQCGLNTKAYETKEALKDGADEIDYVLNVGDVKMGNFDKVKEEMETLTKICHDQNKGIKVIFENCYLTKEEIKKCAEIAKKVKPDFIKTSTGFGTSGATIEDVKLMKDTVGNDVEVKAAGGIHSYAEVKEMIEAGATRIGASATVQIVEEYNK